MAVGGHLRVEGAGEAVEDLDGGAAGEGVHCRDLVISYAPLSALDESQHTADIDVVGGVLATAAREAGARAVLDHPGVAGGDVGAAINGLNDYVSERNAGETGKAKEDGEGLHVEVEVERLVNRPNSNVAFERRGVVVCG